MEVVAHYDAAGAVIGAVPRPRMRAEGLWHACTSVLLRSGDGERVYVHRRTDTKDIFPGAHDCWAGGVVAAGESVEDCATRELAEELGVSGVPLTPLFTLPVELPPLRVHVFAYETHWDGPVVHQEAEVADGWWMSVDELRDRLGDPSWPFVPDGKLAALEWLRRLG
ncbi:NUDIX hydrolase [Actinokineospora diospyrosa]|uniref:NUDIX domain-containing protein n=1 Tax=Actinokineospora diospyrosa TaxID=103728 RepID=A0ABT1I7G8_9PSEU|nr:NUDIX domain-containing protein [Actinokineospora diospyrosa]MCP2268562.1 NUDIX domain-containing protein [Actinokineospora diospyrosa]